MIKHLKIKRLSIFLLLAMVTTLTGFSSGDTQPGYIDISANVARGLMTFEETQPGVKMLRGVIIIDVSPLYTKYHIPGARPYPLEGGTLEAALPKLDPEEIYLVYGKNNKDSMEGAAMMAQAGFKVFRLKDNLNAWKRAGYPLLSYNHGRPIYPAAKYADAPPEVARALMAYLPEMLVIDVSEDYPQGHLPGAIQAAADTDGLDGVIKTRQAGQKVLVYGRTDKESKAAAKKLIQAGFESVFRLKGNFEAWADAGYPAE